MNINLGKGQQKRFGYPLETSQYIRTGTVKQTKVSIHGLILATIFPDLTDCIHKRTLKITPVMKQVTVIN